MTACAAGYPARLCATCPWRVAEPAGGRRIPNFSIDKMRNLACTVGDGDDWRVIFACHGSPEGAEWPCAGYLAVEGMTNLAVRLAILEGRIDWDQVLADTATVDLWPSFADMLAAYEAVLE